MLLIVSNINISSYFLLNIKDTYKIKLITFNLVTIKSKVELIK